MIILTGTRCKILFWGLLSLFLGGKSHANPVTLFIKWHVYNCPLESKSQIVSQYALAYKVSLGLIIETCGLNQPGLACSRLVAARAPPCNQADQNFFDLLKQFSCKLFSGQNMQLHNIKKKYFFMISTKNNSKIKNLVNIVIWCIFQIKSQF